MPAAAQQQEASPLKNDLLPPQAESTSTVGSDATQDPDCTRSVRP